MSKLMFDFSPDLWYDIPGLRTAEVGRLMTFTLEYENEQEAREVARKLWSTYGVTGELGIRPAGDGKWQLEVNSERDLRESTLEKLKGRRVDL